jgi:hypothetical protein
MIYGYPARSPQSTSAGLFARLQLDDDKLWSRLWFQPVAQRGHQWRRRIVGKVPRLATSLRRRVAEILRLVWVTNKFAERGKLGNWSDRVGETAEVTSVDLVRLRRSELLRLGAFWKDNSFVIEMSALLWSLDLQCSEPFNIEFDLNCLVSGKRLLFLDKHQISGQFAMYHQYR